MTIMGTWFLNRGIELRAADITDVSFDHTQRRVTWRLPASKTDIEARGTSRTHGCCCTHERHALCPYHVSLDMVNAVHTRFADNVFGEKFPLFPTTNGSRPSKRHIATAIKQGAALCGASNDITDDIAEHALRVSGAQMFSRAGFELYVIQLIGRWGSDAIKRYVQDTPLLFQSHFAQRTAARLQIMPPESAEPAPPEDLHDNVVSTSLAIQDTDAIKPEETHLIELRKKLESLQATIDNVQNTPHLVVNAKTNCCHLIRNIDGPSTSWRTHCGDTFSNWTYELHRLLPPTSWPCSGCHQLRQRKKNISASSTNVTVPESDDSDHSDNNNSNPNSSSESE